MATPTSRMPVNVAPAKARVEARAMVPEFVPTVRLMLLVFSDFGLVFRLMLRLLFWFIWFLLVGIGLLRQDPSAFLAGLHVCRLHFRTYDVGSRDLALFDDIFHFFIGHVVAFGNARLHEFDEDGALHLTAMVFVDHASLGDVWLGTPNQQQ